MKDLFSVEGKVALVTGGSRGIGEMIASGFLANGVKVYISSRKSEVCHETAKRISTRQAPAAGTAQISFHWWVTVLPTIA